jgi:acetyl esterase/lipase
VLRIALLAALLVPLLFLALWCHAPAPTLELWYVAALANEERLVVAVLLVVGGVQAVRLRQAAERDGAPFARQLLLAALALSTAVLAFGAWFQHMQVIDAGRRTGALTSIADAVAEYVAAPWRSAPEPTATHMFAEVEGRALELDFFAPTNGASPAPLIVRVHGGSWAFGARTESPHLTRWFTERGCAVATIDYRLTPPPRWRDATGDVKAAVAWCRREARTLNIDPARIVLFGTSAGGHLALLAAYTAGDERLPPTPLVSSEPSPSAPAPIDTSVAAVIAFSPPVVLGIGFESPRPWWYPPALRRTNRVEELLGGTPSDVPDLYQLASPITHVSEHTPPTFLAHGEHDELVWPANCKRLAERLAGARVPHELLLLPATDHLFEQRAGGFALQVALDDLAEFIDEHVVRAPGSR